MENTLELSMTEIEFQFDKMDDFDDAGDFDIESEIIQNTEVLEMRFNNSHPEFDELNMDIGRRKGKFPDQFGSDDDLDGYFDE